jgi:hypothetical protein
LQFSCNFKNCGQQRTQLGSQAQKNGAAAERESAAIYVILASKRGAKKLQKVSSFGFVAAWAPLRSILAQGGHGGIGRHTGLKIR